MTKTGIPHIRKILQILVFIACAQGVFAQTALPRADFEHSFYMLPLFEKIRVPGYLSYEQKEEQMLKMMDQLGQGNLYHRLGFSMIYSPQAEQPVREMFELARKHGAHAGLIFALQSHTRNDYRNVADKDLRLYQWRMDGEDWKGAFTTSGSLEVAEDQRDYKIPTPSRLAVPLKEYNAQKAGLWAEYVLKLMADYPGVVACINGPIEEELAIGGHSSVNKLADYSPYAITEFRDWLRHTGIYDDTDGTYAGEGATVHVIGDLVDFNGTLRSQFYDDPTPENSNGTGLSFNDFFGKQFSTWSLRYWDLQIFPDPITDPEFNCTPEFGTGFTPGGFDAPRVMNGSDRFWDAWTYDIPDQGGLYPEGNPADPGFGFRQNLVRNFVRDLFDVLEEAGLPREMMFAHQIPGEALGNFTGAEGRNRSSASNIWTGYMEKSNTVGITRFGDIDPTLLRQYAPDWGIFEWHTLPNPHLRFEDLYSTSADHLKRYYAGHCHILFPGWWRLDAPASDETFPLNDSKFAEAIGDFMASREERPFRGWDDVLDFIPPKVRDVVAAISDSGLAVSWDDHLWSDLVPRWHEWDGFGGFEIELSRDGQLWFSADTVQDCQALVPYADTIYQVRVRAQSMLHTTGEWSDIISSFRDTSGLSLILEAEYESLFADPDITNRIGVQFNNPELIFDSSLISMTIKGEGSNQNTSPVNPDSIEMYWSMSDLSEIPGQHGLDNMEVSGGIFSATVSSQEPVDPYFFLGASALNGTELPHIAFRMYSSIANSGQIYWFVEGGHYSATYPIAEGWQVISLDSPEEWVNLEQIKQFRIDPGTVGGARIKVDWVSVSSKKLENGLTGDIHVGDHEVSMITSPTANPGGYTVVVNYASLSDSICISTDTVNADALIRLIQPEEEGILELGNSLALLAEAEDMDGQIESIRLMAGDSILKEESGATVLMNWKPQGEGVFNIYAVAQDNAGAWTTSDSVPVEVFMQQAYPDVPHAVPCTIEAEDFDRGGEAVAYHDSDAENLGGAYRQEGVDIVLLDGGAENYCVDWMEDGEWLEYLLEVPEGMKTEIALVTALEKGSGEVHLELDDVRLTQRILIPTGSAWDSVFFRDVYLPPGMHRLKLVADKGGFRFDKMNISGYKVYILGMVKNKTVPGLYPNPAADEIRITMRVENSATVRIWSMEGSLVQLLEIGAGIVHPVNVQSLCKGVYILDVMDEQGHRTNIKFIKK